MEGGYLHKKRREKLHLGRQSGSPFWVISWTFELLLTSVVLMKAITIFYDICFLISFPILQRTCGYRIREEYRNRWYMFMNLFTWIHVYENVNSETPSVFNRLHWRWHFCSSLNECLIVVLMVMNTSKKYFKQLEDVVNINLVLFLELIVECWIFVP